MRLATKDSSWLSNSSDSFNNTQRDSQSRNEAAKVEGLSQYPLSDHDEVLLPS